MLTLRLPDQTPRTLAEAARALRAAAPSVPLLVSDRVDVALAVDADGVHVGSSGLSAAAVRGFVPNHMIIGASLGSDREVVRAAGADFVAIGPVFSASAASGSESLGVERLAELARACQLPALAVGGISPSNAASVMAAGAVGVAVLNALLGADDPAQAARELRSVLDASGT